MIEFADRRDHGYSKGHTLKVALAHALVHRPKNLLLDAPTSGLHIAGKRVVRQLIRDVRDDGGCVLFCGHSMQKWKQSRTRSSSLRMRELLRQRSLSRSASACSRSSSRQRRKVSAQGMKPKCDEAKGNHIGDPIPLLMQYAHPPPSRRLRRLSATEYALSEDRRPRISQISKRRSRNTGHPNRRHAWPVVSERYRQTTKPQRLSPQYRTRSST